MSSSGTALVLGGGGVTGVAWELGLLTGLLERGIDLTSAELILGTSAGAAVGAQVTSGAALSELFARQLKPSSTELPGRLSGWYVDPVNGLDLLEHRRVERAGDALLYP